MPEPSPSNRTADLLYDTTHSAAIGASIVAVFFLIVDAVAGNALFTPSMMGTALFQGVPPEQVTEIRLDMMALYTLVHFGVFLVLGLAISLLASRLPGVGRSPLVVGVVLFVALTAGLWLADLSVIPGAVDVIGPFRVLAANALTSAGMAVFLGLSRRSRARSDSRPASSPEVGAQASG